MTRRHSVAIDEADLRWLRELAKQDRRNIKNQLAVILSKCRNLGIFQTSIIRDNHHSGAEGDEPSAAAVICEGRDGLAHDRANA